MSMASSVLVEKAVGSIAAPIRWGEIRLERTTDSSASNSSPYAALSHLLRAPFDYIGLDLSPWVSFGIGLCNDLTGRSSSWSAIKLRSRLQPLGGQAKRVFDILVASVALIIFSPLMIIVAVLIRVVDKGPIVYGHSRIGFLGRPFKCLKFRTMVQNGDEVLARYLENCPEAAREWNETRKLSNDPRVTPIGRVLRKTSIDELPQLFNVLLGEMSCVGPRPIVKAELEHYGHRAQQYLSTNPGLTGVWQVSGRSKTTYSRRVAFDTLYVRNWSLWLDLRVLVLTIPAVLKLHEAS